jgi:hypothetical protein
LKRRYSLAATFALAATVVLVGAGCGSSGDSGSGAIDFSGAPDAVLTTQEGSFRVEVRTAPEPPTRGSNTMQLHIIDVASGEGVDALDVVVVPWMPVMGHGASVKPTVKHGDAPGTYVVDGVHLFMPGTWELRTTLARGATVEHATPSFQIP